MAAKHRVLVVVGTRPEAIKMAPVVLALRACAWAEVRVVATAQHRELLDRALAFFGIRPDRDLDVMRHDQSLSDLAARALAALEPVFAAERPDLVLAQGDTTTVLAAALCCFHRQIAFGHVEAGLRTGDALDPFPEEMNRVLVARLARLHFAPTEGARQNLLREGVPAAVVFTTGNTGIDALAWTLARAAPSEHAPPPGRRLVLVTVHRRENFARLPDICAALRELADRGDVHVLLPVHPNPNVRGVVTKALAGHAAIRLVEPLEHPAMVAAMRASALILTDSGGVQEEAPTLGVPVLVLRAGTERPEGVAAGAARLVGTERARIVAEAARLLDDAAANAAMARVRHPYGDGRAAERIVAALASWFGRA
jgi:UDP-N-acetylglucosamine 2-epimerase (non-hydrolysing)